MSNFIGNIVENTAGSFNNNRIQEASLKLANTRSEDVVKAAKDFEAIFITQMIKHMFEGVETDENFGGGSGEDTMKTLLFDEYGKTISNAGGIGIAENIQRELLAMQEV